MPEDWIPKPDPPEYVVKVCKCPEGPYFGAQKWGTPMHCERCGFLTEEQIDLIKKGMHE